MALRDSGGSFLIDVQYDMVRYDAASKPTLRANPITVLSSRIDAFGGRVGSSGASYGTTKAVKYLGGSGPCVPKINNNLEFGPLSGDCGCPSFFRDMASANLDVNMLCYCPPCASG